MAVPRLPIALLVSAVAASALRPGPLASRRALLASAACACVSPASAASLGYVDDAGSKSYSQVQRAWEKSAGMSQREVLMAARGAGKVEDPSQESDRSRKRRAMAGCKDDQFRKEAGYGVEAECNSRVLGGDPQFMLDVLDAQ